MAITIEWKNRFDKQSLRHFSKMIQEKMIPIIDRHFYLLENQKRNEAD